MALIAHITLWLLLAVAHVVTPVEVIGFDCSGLETELTAVSTSSVRPCPVPEEYGEVSVRQVQVVQLKEFEHLQIRTCLVKVTRHITYCGQGSHSAQVLNGYKEYVKFLGRDGCMKLHVSGGFQFEREWVSGVEPNSTTYANLILAGSVTSGGACTQGTYNDAGEVYQNVLVTASLQITVSDYTAVSQLERGDLHLRTGEVCPFTKNYCIAQSGEVVWDAVPKGDCRPADYDVIYQGAANYTVVPGVENMTYALVADGKSVFALQLLRPISVCGQMGFQTEHDRIRVVERGTHGFVFSYSTPMSVNADSFAYYNTKASAQEVMSLKRINDLQSQSIYGRCKVRREVLEIKLSMAQQNPEAIVRSIKRDPGYSGVVEGDVLFIRKCQPVPVTLRNDTDKCYNQLPVTWQGEAWFLGGSSRILTKHAEEVTCSDIITPTYHLAGKWWAFTPERQPARLIPEVLAPEKDQALKFRPLHEIAVGGLYTAEVMKKLQSSMQFPNQRAAVVNVLTRRVMGQEADMTGYMTGNIFTQDGLEQLSQSMFGRIGRFFHKFGYVSSILIGMAAFGYVIKLVLDMTFYGRLLYGVFGCGFSMLAGMCTGLAGAMLHKQHTKAWGPERPAARRRTRRKAPRPARSMLALPAPSVAGQEEDASESGSELDEVVVNYDRPAPHVPAKREQVPEAAGDFSDSEGDAEVPVRRMKSRYTVYPAEK